MRTLIVFLALAVAASAQVITRSSGVTGGGGGVSDHGALTGLTDDDHPLYRLFQGCPSASELTISSGGVTITQSGCYDIDTESDAASDDLTAITCPAGAQFVFKAESDARTVVLKSANYQVYGATDQSLDQDGDMAVGFCSAVNTPVIFAFSDEAGEVRVAKATMTGSGPNVLAEIAAPGAASVSGNHNYYFNSANGRMCSHKNGGSEVCAALVLTHATDCTSVTNHGTGVALKEGDICHESDADALYSYDGAAWDAVGGGGGSTCGWAVIPLSLPGEDNGSANPGANVTNTNNPGEGRDTNGTVNTGAYLFLNAGGTVYFKFEVPHNWSNSCGEIGVQFTGRSAGANGTQVATFDVQIGSGDENTDHAMSPDAPTGGATALSDNTNINSMSWSGALDDETINAGFAAVMSVSRDAADTDVNTVYILSGAVFIPIDNSVNPY